MKTGNIVVGLRLQQTVRFQRFEKFIVNHIVQHEFNQLQLDLFADCVMTTPESTATRPDKVQE